MNLKTIAHKAISVPIGRWVISAVLMAIILGLVWHFLGSDPELYKKVAIVTTLIIGVSGGYLVLSGKAFDPNR